VASLRGRFLLPERLLVVALLDKEADLGHVPPLCGAELVVVLLEESEADKGRFRLRWVARPDVPSMAMVLLDWGGVIWLFL